VSTLENGFRHDVRFRSSHGADGITAECKPCDWRVWIDNGHTAPDLTELERQHCGNTAAAPVADSDQDRLLAAIRLVLDAFDWESDDAHYALEQIDDVLNGADQ
jgi:hypothetical protein